MSRWAFREVPHVFDLMEWIEHRHTGTAGMEGAGSYYVLERDGPIAGLNFVCPGCLRLGTIGLGPKQAAGVWEWNGDTKRPTARPSILHNSPECGWHGWLTDGVFHL